MNSVLYCLHNLSQKSHLRRMEKFTQHGDTSCLLHTIAVAYYSIKIAEFFGIKYKKRDLTIISYMIGMTAKRREEYTVLLIL